MLEFTYEPPKIKSKETVDFRIYKLRTTDIGYLSN